MPAPLPLSLDLATCYLHMTRYDAYVRQKKKLDEIFRTYDTLTLTLTLALTLTLTPTLALTPALALTRWTPASWSCAR